MRRRQIFAIRSQEAEQLRREVIRGAYQETDAEAGTGRQEVLGNISCPNCGKALQPRGAHFHIRACKG